MKQQLKDAIDAARFHVDRGIELPGDSNLVAAWEEIVRLEAKTLLMDSITIPDETYTFLVAKGFDGTLIVCGENAAGESFGKKFKVIPASQAPGESDKRAWLTKDELVDVIAGPKSYFDDDEKLNEFWVPKFAAKRIASDIAEASKKKALQPGAN